MAAVFPRVDGDERAELREVMDQLEVPNGMSLIARTAAIGRQAEELAMGPELPAATLDRHRRRCPATIRRLPDLSRRQLVIRAIRDYFQPDIGEILIDTDEVFEQARAFMGTVMPAMSIASSAIATTCRCSPASRSNTRSRPPSPARSTCRPAAPSSSTTPKPGCRRRWLRSCHQGFRHRGNRVPRPTSKQQTELARQLRLRDLGGLIVIDFIDMENSKNQREVENRLRDALRFDRARVQMGKISRFGLMELSRQRLRPALAETSYIPCPRCTGTGHIRSTESAALHILRILEEEAMKENTGAVHVQVPVDVATFLLNESARISRPSSCATRSPSCLFRTFISKHRPIPITRLRHDDLNKKMSASRPTRWSIMPIEDAIKQATQQEAAKPRQEAAIKGCLCLSSRPPSCRKRAKYRPRRRCRSCRESGLFSKIFSWFRSAPQPVEPVAAPEPTEAARRTFRQSP